MINWWPNIKCYDDLPRESPPPRPGHGRFWVSTQTWLSARASWPVCAQCWPDSGNTWPVHGMPPSPSQPVQCNPWTVQPDAGNHCWSVFRKLFRSFRVWRPVVTRHRIASCAPRSCSKLPLTLPADQWPRSAPFGDGSRTLHLHTAYGIESLDCPVVPASIQTTREDTQKSKELVHKHFGWQNKKRTSKNLNIRQSIRQFLSRDSRVSARKKRQREQQLETQQQEKGEHAGEGD